MNCATIYCDVDEAAIILSCLSPTAQKEHKCNECRRMISRGERYLREATLFEGKIETWKTCIDCLSIRDEFFKQGFFYGETKSMVRDYVRDVNGDVPESCLSALTPGARSMVCSFIEEEWEDAFDMDDGEDE